MIKYGIIDQIKEYANKNNVPIMSDSGIRFLTNYIKDNNIKDILEIGTAIGYSAIMMAITSDDIHITTIERDEKRYLEAIKNVKKMNLEDRIHLVYKDAFDVKLSDKFDLIFIDAESDIESRNLRQLVRKIKDYKKFLENNNKYRTSFIDVGDGIAVSRKVD